MITPNDVQKIASLARVHLKEDEISDIAKNLEAVLGYVNKLQDLDVSGVEPTTHVLPLKNVYREDEVKASLSQDKALSISVEKAHGSFVVPKVIE